MVRHAVIYKSCSAQFTYAAIAQPVERILGKDEVASSNLASSSKFPYGPDIGDTRLAARFFL